MPLHHAGAALHVGCLCTIVGRSGKAGMHAVHKVEVLGVVKLPSLKLLVMSCILYYLIQLPAHSS